LETRHKWRIFVLSKADKMKSSYNPIKSMQVKNRKTGEIVTAFYGLNRLKNLRLHINGKFISDKDFNKKYEPINEAATQ
jgi:hypothetical protein